MNSPQPVDESIDLEVASQQELGRIPACNSDSQMIDLTHAEELRGPHSTHRCGNAERELLKNCFPTEEL